MAIICADRRDWETGMTKRLAGAVGVALIGLAIAVAPSSAAELGSVGGFAYVKKSEKLGDTTSGTIAAKKAEAKCPDGAEVAGGGTSVSGDPLASYVSTSGPKQKSWLGGGWHFDTPKGKVTTWGICSEHENTRISSEVLNVNGSASANFAPGCGSDHVASGGILPEGGIEEWWLNTGSPVDGGVDGDDRPDDAWLLSAWHRPTFPSTPISMNAVCMEQNFRYEVKGVAFSTQTVITLTQRCPRRRTVVGGGPSLSGPSSQAHVAVTAPTDLGDKDKVPDDGWTMTVANPAGTEIDAVLWVVCA